MIEWRTELNRSNFKRSLIITCPVCGREGRLVSAKPPKMTGRSFRVYHNGSICKISWTHPAWEAVSEIYSKVRKQDTETYD